MRQVVLGIALGVTLLLWLWKSRDYWRLSSNSSSEPQKWAVDFTAPVGATVLLVLFYGLLLFCGSRRARSR